MYNQFMTVNDELLYDAAKEGNLLVIQDILTKKKSSVNVTDISYRTALHHATYNGHLECVQYLIKREADVNAKDMNRDTSLHHAAYRGYFECVQIFHAPDAKRSVASYAQYNISIFILAGALPMGLGATLQILRPI